MNKTTAALKLAETTLRDIIRVYKFETGTPVTALAAIREALAEPVKQEPVATDLMDMLRLIETIKYLRGIAERGLGREIREDETIEQFVLGYVKQLESTQPVKQEPVATVNANDEGYWMMLTGGKLGEASCAHCNRSLGAAITCHHCGYINSHVDSVYTSPEHVEKTAKSIHDKSTNLCQNSTELVETDKSKMRHRYAGSFGG